MGVDTQGWIEKQLRLQVNATKSGVGRGWERKFLGFRLNRAMQIEAAPASLERFKAKVREKWRSCQSLTSNQLRDAWRQYIRGWWGYYRLAENRRPIYRLEGWIRRHIRKCFWLRGHEPAGRERRLRSLGLRGRMLSSREAWHLAGTGSLQSALSNATLRRHGLLMPSDLAGNYRRAVAAAFGFGAASGAGATLASASGFSRPICRRSSVSIPWRISALSFRNWRAFSRPCPMRSPL